MHAVYEMVIFDLDGTLTKSDPGILSCVKKTLRQVGAAEPPEKTLRKFIGPPLFQSFSQFCGMPDDLCDKAVQLYRRFYDEGGIFENALYPHTREILTALRQGGAYLCVATSKPQPQAETVVRHFELTPLLDLVCGAEENDRAGDKTGLIQTCLRRFGVDPDRAVMIGDTHFDARGAAGAHTDFIGVLHGYGTKSEMETAFPGAKFSAGFAELFDLLLTE